MRSEDEAEEARGHSTASCLRAGYAGKRNLDEGAREEHGVDSRCL